VTTNVSIKVNAVVYFRVLDSNKAVVEVENYFYATSQLAQTTLRSVIGQSQLDELLSERDKINLELQDNLGQTYRALGDQGILGGDKTGGSSYRDAAGHRPSG